MSATNFLVTPGPAVTLASGAPAGAGEQVKADPENSHDARLVASGRLAVITDKDATSKERLLERAKALQVKGRTKMTVPELVDAISAAESADAEKE